VVTSLKDAALLVEMKSSRNGVSFPQDDLKTHQKLSNFST